MPTMPDKCRDWSPEKVLKSKDSSYSVTVKWSLIRMKNTTVSMLLADVRKIFQGFYP